MSFCFLTPKDFWIICVSNLLTMKVHGEDYSNMWILSTKLDIYVFILIHCILIHCNRLLVFEHRVIFRFIVCAMHFYIYFSWNTNLIYRLNTNLVFKYIISDKIISCHYICYAFKNTKDIDCTVVEDCWFSCQINKKNAMLSENFKISIEKL